MPKACKVLTISYEYIAVSCKRLMFNEIGYEKGKIAENHNRGYKASMLYTVYVLYLRHILDAQRTSGSIAEVVQEHIFPIRSI